MKRYLLTGFIALSGLSTIVYTPNVFANKSLIAMQKDSLAAADERILQDAYIYSNQSLLSAKLAIQQGSSRDVKAISAELLQKHMQLTEALRMFAKSKQVNLPLTLPQGGQRPDGRIDAAPENLRDTSRIQVAGGEALGGKKQGNASAVDGVEVGEEVLRLKKLSGDAFDKAYIKSALSAQNNLLRLFKNASASGDQQIKSFASKFQSVAKQMVRKLEKLNKYP